MRFVAGGTGRCGTVWFQQALNLLGADVTHEQVFTFRYNRKAIGIQDGEVAAAAAAYKEHIPEWWPVVQLVRDPFNVILSYYNIDTFGKFEKGPLDEAGDRFRYAHTTLTPDMDKLTQTILYVLEWDDLWRTFEARNPYSRVHIERLTPSSLQDAAMFLLGPKPSIDDCHFICANAGPLNTTSERRLTMRVTAPRITPTQLAAMLEQHPLQTRLEDRRKEYGYV